MHVYYCNFFLLEVNDFICFLFDFGIYRERQRERLFRVFFFFEKKHHVFTFTALPSNIEFKS
jgi:hypothetical protein